MEKRDEQEKETNIEMVKRILLDLILIIPQ